MRQAYCLDITGYSSLTRKKPTILVQCLVPLNGPRLQYSIMRDEDLSSIILTGYNRFFFFFFRKNKFLSHLSDDSPFFPLQIANLSTQNLEYIKIQLQQLCNFEIMCLKLKPSIYGGSGRRGKAEG